MTAHPETGLLPLRQEDLRVVVPQLPYKCGNTQKSWSQRPPILFSTYGCPSVKLLDAANGRFEWLEGRDEPPFDWNCRGITIRIHFPGYPSSTDVEKTLKERSEKRERPKARSMQLSTRNYKDPPEPVTRSKLLQELSKRIQWHIADLQVNSDLFPFDHQVDERWCLGQGKMKFEHMVITQLDHVSSGSWSPVICLE